VALVGCLFVAPDRPAIAAGPPPPTTATDPAPGRAEARSTVYQIGPEDLLEIRVFEVPDLNRTVRVSGSGTISLPLLGELDVHGLTPMQLEQHLRDMLAQGLVEDPQASVFVKEYGSRKVSVIGAIGASGVYELLGPRTLLEILSQAGGLTEHSGAELFVLRNRNGGDQQRIAVNVADLIASRNPALNILIEPGDIISVPLERPIYVYVEGAVRAPGRIDHPASRSLSLLQAIARAGGPTDRADLKEIHILRVTGDEQPEILVVNLKRIRKGKDPDVRLQEDDIIVVRETFF
jgi:polysaccharide export outer membrane protein